MGKKAFSTKQKREQLRLKRSNAAAADAALALDGKTAGTEAFRTARRKSSASDGKRTPAPSQNQGRGRYCLDLGGQGGNRDADRELAHVPVKNGDDAQISVMDVRKVRPDGFASVPRRPTWSYNDDKAVVDRRERAALDRWMKGIKQECYFEHNLETWRQLWRVVERSDVLVLVIDIRFPALHFVPDLYRYVKELPGKEMLVALNKCDLVSEDVREAWRTYFEYNYDLRVATFSSFPDANLAPCDANSELLSKRERRMARSKLAAWGADQLAEAVASLPLPKEKQAYLTAWRDAVHTAHSRNVDNVDDDDIDNDTVDVMDAMGMNDASSNMYRDGDSRLATHRSFSPVSDGLEDTRDPPESNKERSGTNRAPRRKRRRAKPDFAAIAAARSQTNYVDPITSPVTDSASVVSIEDDWARDDMLTIGMVGHPNTGKSSMINGIFRKKVVSTSRTPGHTKHLQTMFLADNVRLCDCPGLVFPAIAPKELQTLAGMFPIAQLREPYVVVKYLADRVPLAKILGIDDEADRKKLRVEKGIETDVDEPWTAWTLCEAWALKRGFRTAKAARLDVFRAANSILRLALEGRIVLSTVPPGSVDEEKATRTQVFDSMLDTEYKKLNTDNTITKTVDSNPTSDSSSSSDEDIVHHASSARTNAFLLLDANRSNMNCDSAESGMPC